VPNRCPCPSCAGSTYLHRTAPAGSEAHSVRLSLSVQCIPSTPSSLLRCCSSLRATRTLNDATSVTAFPPELPHVSGIPSHRAVCQNESQRGIDDNPSQALIRSVPPDYRCAQSVGDGPVRCGWRRCPHGNPATGAGDRRSNRGCGKAAGSGPERHCQSLRRRGSLPSATPGRVKSASISPSVALLSARRDGPINSIAEPAEGLEILRKVPA
jgi:hypothetical protein